MQHFLTITNKKYLKLRKTIFYMLIKIPCSYSSDDTISENNYLFSSIIFRAVWRDCISIQFSPGALFALRNTFSEKLLLATFLLCCKIYSFYLLILVDFTFSMKISLSWNSIPCNFINSFCICSGIIANQSLYFYRFYQSVIQRHNFPASL